MLLINVKITYDCKIIPPRDVSYSMKETMATSSLFLSFLKLLLLFIFVLDLITITKLAVDIFRFPVGKGVVWLLQILLSIGILYHGVKGCISSFKHHLTFSAGFNGVRLLAVFVTIFTPWWSSTYTEIISSITITEIILTTLLMTVLKTTESETRRIREVAGGAVFVSPSYSKIPNNNNNNSVSGRNTLKNKWGRKRSLSIPHEPTIHEEEDIEGEDEIFRRSAIEDPDETVEMQHQLQTQASNSSALTTTTVISLSP